MFEIRRLNTVDEFNKGVTALTEIFYVLVMKLKMR